MAIDIIGKLFKGENDLNKELGGNLLNIFKDNFDIGEKFLGNYENNKLITSGRYFITEGKVLFSPLDDKYDLNNVNNNISKYNLGELIKKYSDNFLNSDFNNIFITIFGGNKDKLSEIGCKKYDFKNIFGYDLEKYRGNLFKISKNNKKYFLFSYMSDISKIYNNDFYFKPLIISDINLYNPQAFLTDITLYFYQKVKTVLMDEQMRIKLINYIKSEGIDVEYFILNLSEDEEIYKRIIQSNKDTLYYKMFFLLHKNLGTVGQIKLNYFYGFEYLKGRLIPKQIFFNDKGEIDFKDIPGDNKTFLYQKYIREYNSQLDTVSFNYTLLYNEGITGIDNLNFYSYTDINNLKNKILEIYKGEVK